MRALILSAGMGERLRPLTLTRAKPAIEFLNMPMLAFPYFWLDTLDLKTAVFNTHYLPDTVRQAAMHVVPAICETHFTHEDTILGSGGGIWNARFYLQRQETFAVVNADGVVTFPHEDALEEMLEFHESKSALATLLVCPLEGIGTTRSGVWLDNYGEVMNFGKKGKHDYLSGLHYASYMLLSPRIWQYLPEGESNIIYDVIEPAIAAGEKVYGFEPEGMRWFETGSAPEFLEATRECLEFIKTGSPLGNPLIKMLERFGPAFAQRSDFSKSLLIADSAECEGFNAQGFAVIGGGARVEKDVHIENSVILPGAHVSSGENLKNKISI